MTYIIQKLPDHSRPSTWWSFVASILSVRYQADVIWKAKVLSKLLKYTNKKSLKLITNICSFVSTPGIIFPLNKGRFLKIIRRGWRMPWWNRYKLLDKSTNRDQLINASISFSKLIYLITKNNLWSLYLIAIIPNKYSSKLALSSNLFFVGFFSVATHLIGRLYDS